MKAKEFKFVKERLFNLTTAQFREIENILSTISSVKIVSKTLETKRKEVVCPHCSSGRYQRWGKVSDMQRYRCKECKKTYNSLTNTPLARLRKKGRWLNYSQCLNDGLSVRKAAEKCGVHFSTTFRWRHRFLHNSKSIKPNVFKGILEIKESPFRLSFKGNKKEYLEFKSNSSKPIKECNVFALFTKDRYGNTNDDIIREFSDNCVDDSIKSTVTTDSLMCSEDHNVFVDSFRKQGLRHGKLDVAKNEVVKKEIVHIKNVKAYEAALLNWMKRFRGVATKYLKNYLSWFRELDEFLYDIPSERLLIRAKQVEKYNHQ